MADNDLSQITPKKITGLKVTVKKYNGTIIDIAHNVTEISIYESIYTPFLYGELIIVDNSAMVSTFPFVGQEEVLIEWEREGRKMKKKFFITDVFDVKQQLEGVGSYGLSITSEKQMRNAISLFSKAYRGRGDEIIKKVHDEFLKGEPLQVKTKAKTSHSVVFPYMKPIQAIDMIRKHVLADDGTPMFVFESLYGEKPVLDSLKSMLESKPVFDIKPLKTVNTNSLGEGSRDTAKYRGQVYEALITRGYDTLNMLTKGAFASTATVVDISTKEASKTQFSFKEHAPPIAKNWVTEFFAFDGTRIYNHYNTQNYLVHENKLSFCDDSGSPQFPNISTLNERDFLALVSYTARLNTINLAIFMNSVPELEVGKTVTYTQPRFSAKLNPQEDQDDKVNSGKYLIGAIRHYVKNLEYTMSLELIRDGVGEKADFYGSNQPNLGQPPVTRLSILPEFNILR